MKLVRLIAASMDLNRRKAMALVIDGHVTVGGRPVADGTLEVDPARDRVAVDGKPLAMRPHLYLLMYKPRKALCSMTDPERRTTVIDLLARPHRRARPVGRLDYNTTGVLLLTTDGEMAQALLRSRTVKREYMVKLGGNVSDRTFDRWRRGLTIEGRTMSGADVKIIQRTEGHAKVLVTLVEGWYHLIHRMAEQTGMRVMKIHRVRFAGISLGGLAPGTYRLLTPPEVGYLRRLAGQAQAADERRRERSAGPRRRGPINPSSS